MGEKAVYHVGQKVVVVERRGRDVEVLDREVTKIGRKWITVSGSWSSERFDLNGRAERDYGWPPVLYPSREAYEVGAARQEAWRRLHSRVRQINHAPDHLTAEQIDGLLAIVDGAPPTENSPQGVAFGRHGNLPPAEPLILQPSQGEKTDEA